MAWSLPRARWHSSCSARSPFVARAFASSPAPWLSSSMYARKAATAAAAHHTECTTMLAALMHKAMSRASRTLARRCSPTCSTSPTTRRSCECLVTRSLKATNASVSCFKPSWLTHSCNLATFLLSRYVACLHSLTHLVTSHSHSQCRDIQKPESFSLFFLQPINFLKDTLPARVRDLAASYSGSLRKKFDRSLQLSQTASAVR